MRIELYRKQNIGQIPALKTLQYKIHHRETTESRGQARVNEKTTQSNQYRSIFGRCQSVLFDYLNLIRYWLKVFHQGVAYFISHLPNRENAARAALCRHFQVMLNPLSKTFLLNKLMSESSKPGFIPSS